LQIQHIELDKKLCKIDRIICFFTQRSKHLIEFSRI
jgi:hypothetical protein